MTFLERKPLSRRERFERDQDAKIAAGWRCQSCGAEHGRFHPQAPSTRVFIRVVDCVARCQLCSDDDA